MKGLFKTMLILTLFISQHNVFGADKEYNEYTDYLYQSTLEKIKVPVVSKHWFNLVEEKNAVVHFYLERLKKAKKILLNADKVIQIWNVRDRNPLILNNHNQVFLVQIDYVCLKRGYNFISDDHRVYVFDELSQSYQEGHVDVEMVEFLAPEDSQAFLSIEKIKNQYDAVMKMAKAKLREVEPVMFGSTCASYSDVWEEIFDDKL